jgi:hypothetical protein
MTLDSQVNRPVDARYALLIGLGAALFLIGVGLGPETLPFPPGAAYSDVVVSHWPNTLYFQRAVQGGTWPEWRPLLMSGQPFAANPLNKVWYPPHWLALILPTTLHLNVMVWLHLAMAGLGMRALGEALGIGSREASVMGITYMLAPRLVAGVGAGHLDVMYAMAWFPAVLWAVCRVAHKPHLWLQRGALLGALAALCFLADMRISIFVFVVAAALGAWMAWRQRGSPRDNFNNFNLHMLLATGTVATLTLMLTAAQWLPLVELAPHLSRGNLTPTNAALFSLEPLQFVGLLMPRQPGPHEVMLYSGLLVLIMAIIGTFRLWQNGRRGIVLFWWALIVIAAWYALGRNSLLWTTLTTLVPALLWFRVPPRIWIVAVMALVVLMGYGLRALIDSLPAHLRRTSGVIGVVGGLIVGELLWTDIALIRAAPQREWLEAYTPIARALLDDGVRRFYSPSYSFPQQASAFWGIPDFGGVDPFQLRDYIPIFEAATGTYVNGYSVTLPSFEGGIPANAHRAAVIDAAALADWEVSHIVASFPIQNADLVLRQQIGEVYIYRNRLIDSRQDQPLRQMTCCLPVLQPLGVLISACGVVSALALLVLRRPPHA